jgi:hypothetical protein
MPPKRVVKKKLAMSVTAPPAPVCVGNGMTSGLEIWKYGDKMVLVDVSADGRFANDVTVWNNAAGLNEADCNRLKDATKQDST